jgi:hypothetical protein
VTQGHPVDADDVDPFDLPDWLGRDGVVWAPDHGIHDAHLVRGELTGGPGPDVAPVPCDLLAVDEAYPVTVADDDLRHRAHQAWRHDQVLLVRCEGRLTLATPGTSYTAETVLEALARLAKAVGADPDHYAALLRLGG